MAESVYLTTAVSIAGRLMDTAVPTPSGASWDGDSLVGDSEGSHAVVRAPVGPYLYDGRSGIGWFLGHLAASTRDQSMARVAADVLMSAVDEADSELDRQPPSLFSGATGVAWAACDTGVRLRRPALRRAGLRLARRIAATLDDRPNGVRESDCLAGLAGVLVGLLAIHQRAQEPELLVACRWAAERLAATGKSGRGGTSWPDMTGHSGAPALCGLAHGASGPAWALAEMAWATGATSLPDTVHSALRYERGWFSPLRCAWADLREPPPTASASDWPNWTTAWCHGALGIGAVRLRIYEQTRDLTALAEATAAIEAARRLVASTRAALRHGATPDVTLCHGVGGAIELMLLAYEVTGEMSHHRAARRAGDLCLSICTANRNRWTVGVRGADVVPGLMVGCAGIGVTMMRLHDQRSIGSPLLPGRQTLEQAVQKAPRI